MKEQKPPDPVYIAPLSTPGGNAPEPVRPGADCPRCGAGRMDYNGLLELECVQCGYVISGGGGCT